MKLNPYLNFNGQCEEALKFYQKCLGGEIVSLIRFSGSPMEQHTPPEWREKIMHGRLIVNDQVLMASDTSPDRYSPAKGFSVTLNIAEPAEAERVFHALSDGGTIQMPIQETFWALRFASFIDRFGTPWMINCEKPM